MTDPCIPRAWREYEITYRKGTTLYHIKVANPQGVNRGSFSTMLDGVPVMAQGIALLDDQQPHEIRLVLENRLMPTQTRQLRFPAKSQYR